MGVDVVTMESVIDRLGRHRFLAFDRDHSSGAPTVEVAHEALLWEWDRLRRWIDEGRHDIGRRASLDAAVVEWVEANHDNDYLLVGNRLSGYEQWRATTSMSLTAAELDYLNASRIRQDDIAATESARAHREATTNRRARRRRWGLLVAGVVRPDNRPSVAVLNYYAGRGADVFDTLVADGLDRATADFDIDVREVALPMTDIDDAIETATDAGTDLIATLFDVAGEPSSPIGARHPQSIWGYIDVVVPGSPSLIFAEHEGSFLVGAAAALTSRTGTIGFVGGFQLGVVERFRAGFEAGARAVNPSIKILATYLGYYTHAFSRDDLARAAATDMYARGADVIFHAAGYAGYGVFAAARASSTPERHLWAIGADSDQYLDVDPLARQHVLTSMVKKLDVAVYELVRMLVVDELRPGVRRLGLADGAVDYSTTGGHLSDETLAALERYREEIVAGTRIVPSAPHGPLEPPAGSTVTSTLTITFDGTTCRHDAPAAIEPGVVRVVFVNTGDADALADVSTNGFGMIEVPAIAGEWNSGYAKLDDGLYEVQCVSGFETTFAGPSLKVGS